MHELLYDIIYIYMSCTSGCNLQGGRRRTSKRGGGLWSTGEPSSEEQGRNIVKLRKMTADVARERQIKGDAGIAQKVADQQLRADEDAYRNATAAQEEAKRLAYQKEDEKLQLAIDTESSDLVKQQKEFNERLIKQLEVLFSKARTLNIFDKVQRTQYDKVWDKINKIDKELLKRGWTPQGGRKSKKHKKKRTKRYRKRRSRKAKKSRKH